MVYEFTLAFRHLDLDDDEVLERLDVVVPGTLWCVRDGEAQATVTVEARDPVAAALKVETLVRQVVPAADASHVVEDLVAIPDIAARVKVDREAVRHWVNGSRGPGGFPRPRGVVGDRVKVWDWPVVNDWLRHCQNKVIDSNFLFSRTEAARVDAVLDPLPEGLAAGVGITPGEVSAVLTDHTGNVKARVSREIPRPGTPEQAAEVVSNILADSEFTHTELGAASAPRVLGVHVGGHVNHEGQIVLAPRYQNGKDWKEADLRGLLQRATGVQTVVQNDANALALFERYFGVGRTVRTFVVVLLNAGVGAGIVSDGQLVTGWQGAAGEVGHLVVAFEGYECACRNSDCLECVAAVPNIVRAVDRVADEEVVSLDAALRQAEHDDAAQDVLRSAGEAVGRAASMVLNLINPSHLILYAPKALVQSEGKADIFMAEMQRTLKQYSFSTAKRCEVVPHEWLEERAAIGAAVGALRACR